TGLREVKFEDLTSIGKEAFKGCKKLKVLNFMWCKNLKKFGKNCFYGISKGADIYVYKRSMYTKLCKTSGVPGGVWIHWMW
ncbi:MAG: leucine-rich repeat protein, partial [Lachnospiraceae bacterium]|nr:leucine-rich repeat protein [Lachnospiraceae bacterium]